MTERWTHVHYGITVHAELFHLPQGLNDSKEA
jgi:hypothetical protein